MWYVYILKSINFDRYYIGYSLNYLKRLENHNRKMVRSTKFYSPYEIARIEKYASRSDAIKREKKLKRMKKGKNFIRLVS